MADFHAVVGVESAVTVGVAIEEVAEFGPLVGGEIVGICIDKFLHIVKVGLVTHNAVDGDDVELVDGTPLLCLVDSADR